VTENGSDWLRYQVTLDTRHILNRPGNAWFLLAVLFLIGAVMALVWAEMNLDIAIATGTATGIGIGTSGYVQVLYTRAIALGVLSIGFAAIGVFRRRYTDFVVSYREAPARQQEHQGSS
jgi:hypothetical protein